MPVWAFTACASGVPLSVSFVALSVRVPGRPGFVCTSPDRSDEAGFEGVTLEAAACGMVSHSLDAYFKSVI